MQLVKVPRGSAEFAEVMSDDHFPVREIDLVGYDTDFRVFEVTTQGRPAGHQLYVMSLNDTDGDLYRLVG